MTMTITKAIVATREEMRIQQLAEGLAADIRLILDEDAVYCTRSSQILSVDEAGHDCCFPLYLDDWIQDRVFDVTRSNSGVCEISVIITDGPGAWVYTAGDCVVWREGGHAASAAVPGLHRALRYLAKDWTTGTSRTHPAGVCSSAECANKTP